MKFAIVIPTYNRVEALKKAISHIEEQEIEPNTELFCVICNTASTDGTHDYLMTLKSSQKIKYVIHSSLENSIFVNWRKCADVIPQDMDWVWFHGDDDYLYTPQSVQYVLNLIKEETDPTLSLVHACQSRRSLKTGNVIEGDLIGLCNKIGYHEMLGWMSSLIVRADRFIPALKDATKNTAKIKKSTQAIEMRMSAYPHSAAILEHCYADKALFIDLPLVEPQDTQQTEESMQRWQVERMGERYFFVIDDLLELQKKGALKNGVSKVFFRYLTYNLWDRYASFILEEMLFHNGVSQQLLGYISDMQKMANLFESPSDVKSYLIWFYSLQSEINRFVDANRLLGNSKESVKQFVSRTNIANYSFSVLTNDRIYPF